MARSVFIYALLPGLICIGAIFSVNCIELEYTDITVVGQNNSYQTLNPNATFEEFNKVRHVKGNMIFSIGSRITGDHLILNHFDSAQFSKPEFVEVFLRYPAVGDGQIITFIEILAEPDISAIDAFSGFVTGKGGINNITCQVLVQCKWTSIFSYEVFMYGY